MNIIEDRYIPIKKVVDRLLNKFNAKQRSRKLLSTTLTFIYTPTPDGLMTQKMLSEIEQNMLDDGVLVIPVFGRTLDINAVDDEINKAICLSKKYTDETIKIGLESPLFTNEDRQFLDDLTKDVKPE